MSRSTTAPVHQSNTSHPWTSIYAIQNNSLFLGLSELVNECTSPPVEHLPHNGDPRRRFVANLSCLYECYVVQGIVAQPISVLIFYAIFVCFYILVWKPAKPFYKKLDSLGLPYIYRV